MQYETALGLHRAAEINGIVLTRRDLEFQVDAVEQVAKRQIGRPVDYQTESTAIAVIAYIND